VSSLRCGDVAQTLVGSTARYGAIDSRLQRDVCCDGGVNDHPVDELRDVAEMLVAEAAAFVRARRAELVDAEGHAQRSAVRTKSSPTDPVTVADTETERLVRRRLAEMRPEEVILGEEGGGGAPEAGAVRWVVDPIDGTVNFVYGIPAYAVSLAAQVDGLSVAGAVADVATGDVYSAAVGRGAHVVTAAGRRRLHCNDIDDLSMALVGTGFGYAPQRRAVQAALLAQILPQVRDVRRIGSAALDLCMVAAGRLDAHFEHGLNVWDWAAAALIATEAGAVVVLPGDDAAGGQLVVAAAPGVAAQLTAALDRLGALGPID
jgi:myo-inositol-1(or 4)-monophosphatase